jgi:cell division protein FtsZ
LKFEHSKNRDEDLKYFAIGVGGAGTNMIDNLIDFGLRNFGFIALNTDEEGFERSKSPIKLIIGKELIENNASIVSKEVCQDAIFENSGTIKRLRRILHKSKTIFILSGLGGDTGSAVTPVIARLGRVLGVKIVALVTTPFSFEGEKRTRYAINCLDVLNKYADALIVIPNDSLRRVAGNNDSMPDAFRLTDRKFFELMSKLLSIY